MKPEDFREFLRANGCLFKRSRPDGTEVWTREGLNAPIVFYAMGELTATELARLVRLKGEDPGALGVWRRQNNR